MGVKTVGDYLHDFLWLDRIAVINAALTHDGDPNYAQYELKKVWKGHSDAIADFPCLVLEPSGIRQRIPAIQTLQHEYTFRIYGYVVHEDVEESAGLISELADVIHDEVFEPEWLNDLTIGGVLHQYDPTPIGEVDFFPTFVGATQAFCRGFEMKWSVWSGE